ncbi:hypothetical protein ACWD0A_09970 [Streptomyces sp. NPDC002867]
MALQADAMMELLRQVMDKDPRQRELAADRISDWLNSYSPFDGVLLAGVVSIAAACESDLDALESQLNSLLELGAGGFTSTEHLRRLRDIDTTRLPSNLRDYVRDLLEDS